MERTAILVVNGGADPGEGRWIELCLGRIVALTGDHDHHVFVWNNNTGDDAVAEIVGGVPNATLREPDPGLELTHVHADPLQRLYEEALDRGFSNIVTIDSDAFPLEEGWLPELVSALDGDTVLAGALAGGSATCPAFIHPSMLATTTAWIEEQGLRFDEFPEILPGVRDTVIHLSQRSLSAGKRLYGLPLSNRNTFHWLIGAVHGDRLYHHNAGSRPVVDFRSEASLVRFVPELVPANESLRDQAAALVFHHRERYVGWLRGRTGIDRPGEPRGDLGLVSFERSTAESMADLISRCAAAPQATNLQIAKGIDLAPTRTRPRKVGFVEDPAGGRVVCFRAPDREREGWSDWFRAQLARAGNEPLIFVDVDGDPRETLVSLGYRPRGVRGRAQDRPVPAACREVYDALRAAAGGDEEEAAFRKKLLRLLDQKAECERLKRTRRFRRFLARVPVVRGVLYRSSHLARRLLSSRGMR